MALPQHLSAAEIAELGRELDDIRNEVTESLGDRDRAYILRLIRTQRILALLARGTMLASVLLLPVLPTGFGGWLQSALTLALGAALLAVAKIVENMEIGHNVMHAQWDWMRDPGIQSTTWEWDNVCPSDQWKHSHNVVHHTWTNVIGKDADIGYGIMRVTEHQPWEPRYLGQPFSNLLLMLLFEWGVALHDLEIEKLVNQEKTLSSVRPMLRRIARKAARQVLKDVILWPALSALVVLGVASALGASAAVASGIAFAWTALGTSAANLVRNVWSNMIIFCGHFPSGVHHFTVEEVEGETRGAWYVRQLLGSCNIGGGKLFHILSGNLSHQIEHHLFPDMPSNRYPEIAPRVRALAARYGLPYNTGSLTRQFGTTTWKIWRLAFPGGDFRAKTSAT
jgi:fatty acid desaturase